MNKSGKVNLIAIILITPFFFLYFIEMFNLAQFEVIYAGLVIFAGVIFYSKDNTASNMITKESIYTIIYFILLMSVITLSNLFAIETMYSITRGVYSISLYFFLFFVYKAVNEHYLVNIKWRLFLSRLLTIALVIIIIGQLIIPEWRSGIGGIRLSGGTNANFVSMYALFIIFISHFNSLIDGKWQMFNIINWILGFIVLFWSMSRSAILGFIIFYVMYIGWYFVKGYLNAFLRGRFSKNLVKNTILTTTVFLIVFSIVKFVLPTELYNQILIRFTGEDGYTLRALTWEILLEHFEQNPLFGGVGWFYSASIIPEGSGVAQSAHNTYIRILSEIGLVGLIPILALPILLIIGLLIKSYMEKEPYKERIFIIVGSYLISLFSIIFFENHFLSGLFKLGNLIIIFTLSLGYVLCVKKNVISNKEN